MIRPPLERFRKFIQFGNVTRSLDIYRYTGREKLEEHFFINISLQNEREKGSQSATMRGRRKVSKLRFLNKKQMIVSFSMIVPVLRGSG